jgi:cyanophycinase
MTEEVLPEYERLFKALGVEHIGVLDIRTPQDARREENAKLVRDAEVIFFTGGDQLRITAIVGVTPIFEAMYEMYIKGGTVVGTSAGAAAISETMVIAGESDESNEIRTLEMGAGLGLLREVGIDEDTAIIVEQAEYFQVIGSGAVYIVDGRFISYSNLSETNAQGVLSIFDTRLHILGAGDRYDLAQRRPIIPESYERGGK